MQRTNPVNFPPPKGGASLLLAFQVRSKITLIIGSGSLAASRAFAALEADSHVVILAKGGVDSACDEIRWRAREGQLTYVDWDSLLGSSAITEMEKDIEAFDAYLNNTSGISLVCVTDVVSGAQRRSRTFAEHIHRICKNHSILVNITEMPDLCDFIFTSMHRFEDPDSGQRSPLQIGVTTNGHGCRLASRINREIVSRLPRDVGSAVENVGKMRALAKGGKAKADLPGEDKAEDELHEDGGVTTPNRPVPPRSSRETETEGHKRRIKWVAQISEYWPISKLARMSAEEMQDVLAGESPPASPVVDGAMITPSIHSLHLPRRGRILLVGSGPGHPSLLTIATHTALTKLADLVLSDKLVPDAVLALIPKSVQVRIAKKFPGNAEGAQTEMMEAAVEAANRGLTVVRVSISTSLSNPIRSLSLTFSLAKTGRPSRLRPRRRRGAVLPRARVRAARHPGRKLRPRSAHLRRHPRHPAGRRGVVHGVHRRRAEGQGGAAPRVRPGPDAGGPHGRRAAVAGHCCPAR